MIIHESNPIIMMMVCFPSNRSIYASIHLWCCCFFWKIWTWFDFFSTKTFHTVITIFIGNMIEKIQKFLEKFLLTIKFIAFLPSFSLLRIWPIIFFIHSLSSSMAVKYCNKILIWWHHQWWFDSGSIDRSTIKS